MNLQLSLKTKWFEMTKAGVKTEDYREINGYWCSRLAILNGKKYKQKQWAGYLLSSGKIYMQRCSELGSPINPITFQKFEVNHMTLGYPKKGDPDRIIQFEHAGIEIREGNPDWGAEPGKLYFVIKHGKRI